MPALGLARLLRPFRPQARSCLPGLLAQHRDQGLATGTSEELADDPPFYLESLSCRKEPKETVRTA